MFFFYLTDLNNLSASEKFILPITVELSCFKQKPDKIVFDLCLK